MDREKEQQRDRRQYDREKERQRDRGQYDREKERHRDRGQYDREKERDRGHYDREKERQRDRGQYDREKERDRGQYDREKERDRGQYDREKERDRGHYDRGKERGRDKGYYDREKERGRDKGHDDREKERGRDRGRYDRERGRRHEDQLPRNYHRSASPREHSLRPRSSSGSHSPKLEKGKPNFSQSGLLAAETNTVKAADGTSTVLKYNEPPEARKPTLSWRLYVFKDSEQMELLHIQRQSAYLIGRDRLVSDIAVDHPSCSKQHAAIQYRYIQEKGESKGVVKPFIIDLESTNGTLVNDEKVPTARFYELRAGDVIKFGLSNREYVLLNEEVTS